MPMVEGANVLSADLRLVRKSPLSWQVEARASLSRFGELEFQLGHTGDPAIWILSAHGVGEAEPQMQAAIDLAITALWWEHPDAEQVSAALPLGPASIRLGEGQWTLEREAWEQERQSRTCPGTLQPEYEAKSLLVAMAALVDDGNRILVAQRPEGKPLAGLWEFPGGKQEEGESPQLALVRELKEELGLELEVECLQPLGFAVDGDSDWHRVLLLYVARKWRGVAEGLEGQALRWVQPRELRQLDMPKANQSLIPLLIEQLV